MEQFEQLLTCCVCLDRYRIPKLLPCQHSFCMEPCMEGLIDYVKRQVKCPECRAEHRIPYQGVQAFPTNVTLQRFLELHIEITGELPDPTSGQVMERCNVCSEKSYCSYCAHCDKKICEDCKSAHMDILRREINRVTSQVRRGINRLQDSLTLVEKNITSLQTICVSASEEVDEVYRRLSRALKDRTDHLRSEIDRYLTTEMKFLTQLKSNLELEIKNITSNCDIADKYMTDAIEWDDSELMDTKEIFLKSVEFLRNFEYENTDYNRRVRFTMPTDPNQLVNNLAALGDLHTIAHPGITNSSSPNSLAPPSTGPGLMRSKSDHRLATQFRQQEERGYGDDGPALGGRKFGERPSVSTNEKYGESRYGRSGNEYDYDYDNEPSSRAGKSRFRSRFVRHQHGDTSDDEQNRNVRFNEKEKEKERERVIDTEDVTRGQLSGIIRLTDSPRVMKRLQDQTREKKEKPKIEPPKAQPVVQQQKSAKPTTQRQVSEDDEITRIKRQNKGAATSTGTSETERPAADRVAALKQTRTNTSGSEERDSSPASPVRRTPPQVEAENDEPDDSDGSVNSNQQSKPSSGQTTAQRKPSLGVRSASTESTTSESSSASTSATRNTAPTTGTSTPPVRTRPTSEATVPAPAETKKPFQSRFLPAKPDIAAAGSTNTTSSTTTSGTGGSGAAKDETESSSDEETTTDESDEEEEEEEDEEEDVKSTPTKPLLKETTSITPTSTVSSRSSDTRRNSRDDNKTSSPSRTSGYSSPSYQRSFDRDNESPKYSSTTSSIRSRPTSTHDSDENRYGAGSSTSGYTSRFLNKSKSSAIVPPPSSITTSTSPSSPTGTAPSLNNNINDNDDTADDSDSRYGTGRSRYMALKERRNRLARSRSTHTFGNDDDDLDEPVSPTTASPSAYLASRYGTSSLSGGSDLSRSRSSHALKSRETSPITRPHTSTVSNTDDKDGANLSSWARYLKNKYGNRTSKDTTRDLPSSSTTPSSASSSASRRLSLGLPLRQANELGNSDDDSKNGLGSPTSPMAAAVGITGVAGMSPRTQYLQKRRQLFQLGGRGSEPGSFTWPRGIAVGPDNSIVVADSSNHRVQVFDSNGIFVKEFGQYGNGEGEFDCLAGVAVNRIGQYIIADRYNHRIQVLDPQGRFLRQFGSQGTTDGKFNYPWGITTDALGFIYVCDKENHRVQVFQSDGTFAGKFGLCGNAEGQLEHPHYIAVSNTNRVIVSDSNNHRIQIFDVNGRVLTTFGGEGSDEGQFKFPRGVAVDDQGYICVADSGNNRIQIFHPDGSFLRAFGSWGSGDAEFKGLEGVAIMSNGNILVCDRENHRVQVF